MSPQTGAGVSSGIGVVGSLFAGMAQRNAGKQEQDTYDYNATIDTENAASEAVSSEQYYSQLVGRQATAYAASGVDITRGSPLLMMAATAGRGGREKEKIIQAGKEQSTLERFYGKVAAFRGTMAGIGTFLKGLTGGATSYLDATGYIGSGGRSSSGSGGGDGTGGSYGRIPGGY